MTLPVVYNRKILAIAVAVAAIVVFAVHALDFPGSVPDFVRSSGGGVLLDVKPSFSVEATYQRFAAYGVEGRKNYAFRNVTIDVLLPLAVLPALFLLMLNAKTHLPGSHLAKAFLLSLPFVYVVFDFAENGVVLALLGSFPERMHLLAEVLPYLTVIKRTASLLALGIPLVIFIVVLIRRGSARADRF